MSVNIQPPYIKISEDLKGNPGQWKAYESKNNCVVLAGPGSGKTKLLALKMTRIINEDIRQPQGVACITYSTECAREITKRLSDLGVEPKRNVYIGTVHGFCLNHIIKPYAKLSSYPLPDPIAVADTETANSIFNDSVRGLGIELPPHYLRTTFDLYRRTFLDTNDEELHKLSAEMPLLINRYEENLHKSGLVDFDDMVLIGLRLVEKHAWIRQALKSRFPVLIIDEYQDLGLPLHKLVLQLMSFAKVRLFAVGDPDQSIYGFTGSQPHLLKELSDHPEVEKVELSFNYRCAQKIVDNSVVALGESRKFTSVSEEEGKISFWECPDGIEQQAEIICSKIIPSLLADKANRVLSDISVLYLDKNDAAVITEAVNRHKIKYIGGERVARYKQTPVTRWLEDCAAWSAKGWKDGRPRLSSLIYFWMCLHEKTESKLEEKALRKTLINFLWKNRNPKGDLKTWLDGFVALGLYDILKESRTRADEFESLSNLLKAVSDPNKMGSFSVGEFGDLRGAPDYLNLTTLHSSKGLEFDVVIIMGLEQGRIPGYRVKTQEGLSEERRKFYVALTRAKREVHLLYSGWYKNAYGIFKKGPSEYVVEQQKK